MYLNYNFYYKLNSINFSSSNHKSHFTRPNMHPLKAFKITNSNSQPNLKVDKTNIAFTTNNIDTNNTRNGTLSKSKSTSLYSKSVKPTHQSSQSMQIYNLSNLNNGVKMR